MTGVRLIALGLITPLAVAGGVLASSGSHAGHAVHRVVVRADGSGSTPVIPPIVIPPLPIPLPPIVPQGPPTCC